MLNSLAKCSSLVRLGLIVTSIDLVDGGNLNMYEWDEVNFKNFFVELVEKLPKLIALLIVLPDAPESHCIAATRTVENIFKPKRPCFCVQISNVLNSVNPPNLPFCHYQVLNEDPQPLVSQLPFHIISRESSY